MDSAHLFVRFRDQVLGKQSSQFAMR